LRRKFPDRKKPGFPLQFLGFAYANPVGFPLQSLAPPSATPRICILQIRGRIIAKGNYALQPGGIDILPRQNSKS
jgi:hypothetical protein